MVYPLDTETGGYPSSACAACGNPIATFNGILLQAKPDLVLNLLCKGGEGGVWNCHTRLDGKQNPQTSSGLSGTDG